jgi:hypothetical protein
MIRHCDRQAFLLFLSSVSENQTRAPLADAIHLPVHFQEQRITRPINGKPDARRAGVDGQNTGRDSIHDAAPLVKSLA